MTGSLTPESTQTCVSNLVNPILARGARVNARASRPALPSAAGERRCTHGQTKGPDNCRRRAPKSNGKGLLSACSPCGAGCGVGREFWFVRHARGGLACAQGSTALMHTRTQATALNQAYAFSRSTLGGYSAWSHRCHPATRGRARREQQKGVAFLADRLARDMNRMRDLPRCAYLLSLARTQGWQIAASSNCCRILAGVVRWPPEQQSYPPARHCSFLQDTATPRWYTASFREIQGCPPKAWSPLCSISAEVCRCQQSTLRH
jgi:hypothetical protein